MPGGLRTHGKTVPWHGAPNLKGYRIFYGTTSSNLSQMVDIPNPGISSAVIESLASGTWYFAVKAYNTYLLHTKCWTQSPAFGRFSRVARCDAG